MAKQKAVTGEDITSKLITVWDEFYNLLAVLEFNFEAINALINKSDGEVMGAIEPRLGLAMAGDWILGNDKTLCGALDTLIQSTQEDKLGEPPKTKG